MRIAFVCHEYPPLPHGGIGTFVETVAKGLHQRKHQITVVGFGEKDRERIQDGIRVVELRRNSMRFFGNFLSRLRLRGWLKKQTRKGQIDVIEVPDFQGTLPFSVTGCVVVVRLHLSFTAISLQAGQKRSKGIEFYEKHTLRRNANWIAVSEHILDLTRDTFKLTPARSVVVYNSVPSLPCDTVNLPDLPRNYVLFAGQLSRRKGALVLAEAAREFMISHPDVDLVYVGGGISREGKRPIVDVIRQVVGVDLSSRVHFLGHQRRGVVIECMKKARVFAFPSQLEALPLVVLEAMNCGVPVVCSDCPPGPEMVEHGFNGLLADPRSSADLSEKISLILDNPELAVRLAANARKVIAQKFSLDKCLDQTEQFYFACAASGEGSVDSWARPCSQIR